MRLFSSFVLPRPRPFSASLKPFPPSAKSLTENRAIGSMRVFSVWKCPRADHCLRRIGLFESPSLGSSRPPKTRNGFPFSNLAPWITTPPQVRLRRYWRDSKQNTIRTRLGGSALFSSMSRSRGVSQKPKRRNSPNMRIECAKGPWFFTWLLSRGKFNGRTTLE